MTAGTDSSAALPPTNVLSDCEQALALLRVQGVHLCRPVDFFYMEAMARRTAGQAPIVRRILEAKLAQALAAYQATLAQIISSAPCPSPAPKATALGQLVSARVQSTTDPEPGVWSAPGGARVELRSVRNFRTTWSKLSAQKQVSKALGQAPKNAGPINSHMLVLRSLELMQNISPDYLNRFMSYADTLLCLDQMDLSAKARQNKPLASAKPAARAPTRR